MRLNPLSFAACLSEQSSGIDAATLPAYDQNCTGVKRLSGTGSTKRWILGLVLPHHISSMERSILLLSNSLNTSIAGNPPAFRQIFSQEQDGDRPYST